VPVVVIGKHGRGWHSPAAGDSLDVVRPENRGGGAGVGSTHGAIANARAASCATVKVIEGRNIRLRGAALCSDREDHEVIGATRRLRYVKGKFRGVHSRRGACGAEVDAPIAV